MSTRKRQRTYALAGIVAIGLTLVCAEYLIPRWVDYIVRENTPAPMCQHGPPSHCYRAESDHV